MKINKGDKIKVLSGKDAGKTGKVLHVVNEKNKISAEGINLMYKNMKARKQGEKGQKIQFPAMMAASNVALICPKCGKQTRIGNKVLENKKKVRTCKKCNEII
jgi:large subunit ribosomal protein L24